MFSLPTFLSFPWSLPSLPSISLPANIQRRFLSYVLKRSLGRFVRAGGLDVERIQAQIGEGRVEIERLEIDTDEINSLIPSSIPLHIISGSLAKVTARIPFPNLWSAPLSLSLDTLTLDVLLTSPSFKGKSSSPRSRFPQSPSLDLASSVTTAADEFLHEELDAYEEAELDRSIRQSLVLSQNDPFVQDDGVPGAFPSGSNGNGSPLPATVESTTVLAGLVERVLARLEFKVKDINIRVHHEDSKHGGVFELRVGEIRYADESTSATEEERQQTIRSIKVSGVSIYVLPLPPPAQTVSPPKFFTSTSRSSTSSSSSNSTSASSENENADMIMSQAVADLRQSMFMSAASGASVYQSAYSQKPDQASIIEEEDRSRRSSSSSVSGMSEPSGRRSVTPTATAKEPEKEILILSLGTDDIVLRMTTSRSSTSTASSTSPTTSVQEVSSAVNRKPVNQLPSVDINFSFGTTTSLLLPAHTAMIMSALQVATLASSGNTKPSLQVESSKGPQASLKVHLTVKAVYLGLIYDLSAATNPAYTGIVPQFWSRPSTTDPPVGHLRFRIENLQVAYSSPAFNANSKSNQASRTSLNRRGSINQGNPAPPTLAISLVDASILEYLASAPPEAEDQPPGGSFPVLIFDPNLPRQYEHDTRQSTGSKSSLSASSPDFPDYEAVDWRNASLQRRGAPGEKVWRVRQKGKGVLKGGANAAKEHEGPVLYVKKELSEQAGAVVETLPIHLFLDLSLVERLLPMLRYISPTIKSHGDTSNTSPIINDRPNFGSNRSDSYVLDDLNAQAARLPTQAPSQLATINCPMLRLSIRCPAPVNRRGTWGDGAHLRSGIFTLDIHGLNSSISRPSAATTEGIGKRAVETEKSKTVVEWKSMMLFFCRVPEKRSYAFLVIGPLAPEPGDFDSTVLLPNLVMNESVSPITTTKTSLITCRIPSVQAKIGQSTIEGLQFFADDLTHWLDGAFGDGSRPKPRDELKMIGSRFFGSKASSSASSSMIEADDEEDVLSATSIQVIVSETEITLLVPRPEAADRVLSLKASDVEAKVESNLSGKQEMAIILSVMDADFSDLSAAESPCKILSRTTPLTLTTHTSPIAQIRFASLTNAEDGTKETIIKAILSSFKFCVVQDISWLTDLARFAKTPEGVFEDVVPSEVTRINLQVYDGSVHLVAPTLNGALVLVMGDLEVKTMIESEDDTRDLSALLGLGHVLLIDDMKVAGQLDPRYPTSVEAWRNAGYVQLVEISNLETLLTRNLLDVQDVQLDVVSCQAKISACADSLSTLGPLAADLAKLAPQKEPQTELVRSPTTLGQSINVFASIDEDAFNRIPDMISGADLIEDDLPTNLDYLDHAARHSETPSMDRKTGETIRTWQSTNGDEKGVGEMSGETVKILYAESFDMQEDYWDSLTPVTKEFTDDTRIGKIRVRVQDCAVNVLLHDGYDWQKTRKVIEDEIKSVRKKLERIRQLLASGQTADETAINDNTRSVLFNSVYIGLDQSRDNLDSAALLAAIDEELEDLGAQDTSSISSWQTDFPPGHPRYATQAQRAPSKKHRLKGRRLTRSKKPQIEFGLSGISVELDVFDKENSTASKVNVSVKSMEILDHIKTSTWKKFLVEMKADSRGNVRETDADMVRFELIAVRPSLPSPEEENRVRMKILPLRLHVDQDALDFLKRFFSFSSSDAPADPAKKPSAEPFFQHVEIFPIELKLDYKPKRVDFAALREGKTMELMNFFHFDGAEMTLRHITLSGISGVTRLSTMLQDIWTPDVKANQLADVISGVSPIRSMVNVGSGVADLILLPIEQYRKDGRVSRGVQRGANSFVKSTALEMMKLGARLATGTQVVLEKAESVLGGKVEKEVLVGDVPWTLAGSGTTGTGAGTEGLEGEGSSEDDEEVEVVSRYANQPTGAREGVQAAYKSLSRNVNAAAQTILAVPMEVYERSGEDGPLKTVVRAVPIAVLKPMIGASEAVSKTLLGMRNSLDPQGRAEQSDKYK